MISVIICSRSQDLLEKLKLNIKKTIGVEYEIIAYDNSEASDGICKVYNLCSKKAKFEYLCYIHEDVHFITTDWGKELVSNYTPDTGVIGLAGGMFKSSFPSSWGYPGMEYCRVNIFHISNECHLSQNPRSIHSTKLHLTAFTFTTRTSLLMWRINTITMYVILLNLYITHGVRLTSNGLIMPKSFAKNGSMNFPILNLIYRWLRLEKLSRLHFTGLLKTY
jgi:hypothetical protein